MRCSICDWSPSDSHSIFNQSFPRIRPKTEEEEGYDYATYQRNKKLTLDKKTGDHICSDCWDSIYEDA